jgi:hypothetical protein
MFMDIGKMVDRMHENYTGLVQNSRDLAHSAKDYLDPRMLYATGLAALIAVYSTGCVNVRSSEVRSMTPGSQQSAQDAPRARFTEKNGPQNTEGTYSGKEAVKSLKEFLFDW